MTGRGADGGPSRDLQFTCGHCGARVPWLAFRGGLTARDYCPECLWSRHVDIGAEVGYPPCGAMMRGRMVPVRRVDLRCTGCGLHYVRPTDEDYLARLEAGEPDGGGAVIYGRRGAVRLRMLADAVPVWQPDELEAALAAHPEPGAVIREASSDER